MSESYFRRDNCRLCKSTDVKEVFSLAATPPANAFLPKTQLAETEEKFPLDVFFCNSCAHVQILDVVDPSILFRNYCYVSGTSPVFVKHFEDYAAKIKSDYMGSSPSMVLEIGSNDGSLLKFFKAAGHTVLGIDPALDIAKTATENGINTIADFFSPQLADKVVSEHGKASVVIANNVFAHIDDLHAVVSGIRTVLDDKGIYVFEVSYLRDVVEKTLFDTIYHEHLCYHSIKPFLSFFKSQGMHLFNAERVSSHGGSLRCYVQHENGPHADTNELKSLLEDEVALGLDRAETFVNFAQKIDALGTELKSMVEKLKSEGKKIAGFGAPAKATTLMHHFGLTGDHLDFIVDDSPLKQGLFSPGLHIPVVPSSEIAAQKPDYLLLLAWNFADPIIAKNEEYLKGGGHFIVPLPELRVV